MIFCDFCDLNQHYVAADVKLDPHVEAHAALTGLGLMLTPTPTPTVSPSHQVSSVRGLDPSQSSEGWRMAAVTF